MVFGVAFLYFWLCFSSFTVLVSHSVFPAGCGKLACESHSAFLTLFWEPIVWLRAWLDSRVPLQGQAAFPLSELTSGALLIVWQFKNRLPDGVLLGDLLQRHQHRG